MTHPAPALVTILSLLERQRNALLEGDLETLDGLAQRLEPALARLADTRPDRHDLAGLASLAARNLRLLAAARSGVAQARARLASQRSAPLMTYDSAGRQQGAAPLGQTLSRR